MKRLVIIIALLMFTPLLKAQDKEVSATANKDSTVFKWGNSKIIVVSSNDETDTIKKENIKVERRKKRSNHFAGIDLGINGFLNASNSVSLSDEERFMDLNYSKSIELNINFMEFYIPIAKERFGIVTGLGLGFNNYDLARDFTITSSSDTNATIGVVDSSISIKKNKFKTVSLNLPLLLETNIGKTSKKSFHLAVGGMASYVFEGKTKQKYRLDGQNYTIKEYTNFNLNPFRLAAHARIGYGKLTFYANYSLTSLYKQNRGPELYPFTVGVSLIPF